MSNFTPEMIEKAKVAKTAEELLEIAKANGMEITAEEAATYFAQLNPATGEHKFFKTYKAHQNFLESLKKGD